jgi:lipid-A-disaccharide synthase
MTSEQEIRFLIIAGEASGDLHGGDLVKGLKECFPNSRFAGMGGRKMREQGVETLFDIERMGAVGVVEIFSELPHYIKVYRSLVDEIRSGKYHAAVLIDYPTLNLRLAKHCRKNDCPVFYFISPQIWAWRRGRIRNIRKSVNRMFVVLPFEEEMYHSEGGDAEFLGHPFSDQVRPTMDKNEALESFGLQSDIQTIGLLPGSRMNEVQTLLDVMLEAAGKIREELSRCQFVLPVADTIDPEFIRDKLGSNPLDIRVVEGRSYDVMNCSDFLIIASGSATLEAGILGCPMVIIYRLNPITYWLAKKLVDTEYFGLVNIVAGERVVPELLQSQVTADNIAKEAMAVLKDRARYQVVHDRLMQIQNSLGEPGVLRRVAESIASWLKTQKDHEKVSI